MKLMFTCLLVCLAVHTWAEDSLEIKLQGVLPEVNITGQQQSYQHAPEKLDGIMLAGKQVSLTNVQALNANIVQNSSRQLFARTPGVFIWESDGSGVQTGVAVRGLSPNRSWEFNMRQNGYDIAADPFGYPEAYYTPPLEAVDQLIMIKGSAALQFGPQFGGLLDYKLKSGDTIKRMAVESYQTLGSNGLFSTYNAVGGQLGKFNYRVSFHHRQANGWRENAAYATNHLYGRIAYRPFTAFEVALEMTMLRNQLQQPGGLTDSLFLINAQQSLRQRNWLSTPWNIGALTLHWKPLQNIQIKWVNSLNNSSRSSVGFVKPITTPDTISAITGSYADRQLDKDIYKGISSELRAVIDYGFAGHSHSLALGARYSNSDVARLQYGRGTSGTGADFTLADPDELFTNDLNYHSSNLALFAENVFHVGASMSFVPGLRLEHINSKADGRIGKPETASELQVKEQMNRSFLLVGIGWEWKFKPSLSIHANISSAYRPVTYAQLTTSVPGDMIDPDLKDASGYSAEIGLRGKIGSWVEFDVNVFRMLYGNKVGALTLEKSPGVFYKYQTNLGNSIHHGVEFFTEIKPFTAAGDAFENLSVFTSLTFTDARYSGYSYTKEVSGKLQQITISGNKVEYAPSWIIRSGLSWVVKRFTFDLNGSFISEVYTDANNTSQPTSIAEAGKLPSYTVIDFSSKWRTGTHFSIGASVSNILNARYATRRASGYPGRGLMPNEARTFLFTIGVRF